MFGVINVTQTVAIGRELQLLLLDPVFAQEGLPAYSNAQAAQIAGWIVIGTNLLGLVLAIGFAVPRLRTRRTAFWVPLAAGGVCVVVTTVVILAAVLADPAFVARMGAAGS